MFLRLLLLLIVVPLVELWLLLQLHEATSLAFTLGLVIATGFIGAALARQQGVTTIGRIRTELNAGRMPTASLQDGMMILLAAVLLVTPGLLTDMLGFGLLTPWFRRGIRSWLSRRWRASFQLNSLRQTYRYSAADGWSDVQPRLSDKIIDVRLVDAPGSQQPSTD